MADNLTTTGTAFPPGPGVGDCHFNTVDLVLRVWDGKHWVDLVLRVWDGKRWVPVVTTDAPQQETRTIEVAPSPVKPRRKVPTRFG